MQPLLSWASWLSLELTDGGFVINSRPLMIHMDAFWEDSVCGWMARCEVKQIFIKAELYRLWRFGVYYATACSEFFLCLFFFSITEGCTLKLVLAMRGGPVNTRRGAFPLGFLLLKVSLWISASCLTVYVLPRVVIHPNNFIMCICKTLVCILNVQLNNNTFESCLPV